MSRLAAAPALAICFVLGTALPVQASTTPAQAAGGPAAAGKAAPAAAATAPGQLKETAAPAAPGSAATPATPGSPAKANPAPAGGKSAPAATTSAPASGKGNGAAKASGGGSTAGNSGAGCKQSPYGSSGNSANNGGLYDDTCDGSASGNGGGGGQATGKPCAGCVGKADEKNPGGQNPNTPKAGSDRNNGYECDGNNGIARTNPAHTGCKQSTPPPCIPTEDDPCEPPNPCVPTEDDPCEPPNPCVPTEDDPCEPPAPVCPTDDPDCTEVRGVTFRRTPPGGTRVLGDTAERARAGNLEVGGLTLPVTGGNVLDVMLLGTALVLAGSALSRLAARRRHAGSAARH